MVRTTCLGALCSLLMSNAFAVAVAPCTDALGLDIIPLSNGSATYCVSDYGWSDAWFVGSAPSKYDPRLDVLSGDDAPNLHFGILGGPSPPAASGFGWLSPIMDGGSLSALFLTGSPWTVTTPVHYTTGGNAAESVILHPLGLQILIATTLDPLGHEINQRFRITNTTTGTTFVDLRFADYFNFHPNGSTVGDALKGTVTYSPLGGIRITGIDDGTLIANGSMRGERVDDAHGRNGPLLTSPIDVLDMVQTDTYLDPGAGFAIGPGDVAGGLAWDLGTLAPGGFVEFNIFKLAEPLAPPGTVAEPDTTCLAVAACAWLVLTGGRRRRLDVVIFAPPTAWAIT